METRRNDYALIMARTASTLSVIGPEDGRVLAEVSLARQEDITAALLEADCARPAFSAEGKVTRASRLRWIADAIQEESKHFAELICEESGKPIRYATAEVARAVRTFSLAADEAEKSTYQELDLDGRPALLERFPIGVCAFITPFNFPLNLVAHKVAPALAAGCPFVLKPAEKTPLTALALGEILERCEPPLPDGAFSICVALPEECEPLALDPRVKHLSFTGSATVGWPLKSKAMHATTTLELGGNAGAILCEDWDLEDALNACTLGAFAFSGQVCISLQRLLVAEPSMERAIAGLAKRAAKLKRGPLNDPATEIGPLINEAAAMRIETWVNHAIQAGARLIYGGKRSGSFYMPTILADVPHSCDIWKEEAFGPVVCIEAWSQFEQALQTANDSPWGLQTAVFTHNRIRMEQAFHALEVGQVIIGDSPSFRVDEMPYGGVKQSGIGREGLSYAIEAMTEPRLLVLPKATKDERD